MYLQPSAWSAEKTARESSDPYYDLIEDFDLIVSSFQSQYGLRLSKELDTMRWDEFCSLLAGISPETALGRIVAIRAENDKEVLKHFTREQRRIRSEWRSKRAKAIAPAEMEDIMKALKRGFLSMAGGGGN